MTENEEFEVVLKRKRQVVVFDGRAENVFIRIGDLKNFDHFEVHNKTTDMYYTVEQFLKQVQDELEAEISPS